MKEMFLIEINRINDIYEEDISKLTNGFYSCDKSRMIYLVDNDVFNIVCDKSLFADISIKHSKQEKAEDVEIISEEVFLKTVAILSGQKKSKL